MQCFEDSYDHLCAEILYIEENIPGPTRHDDPESLAIADRYNSQISVHCECQNGCTTGTGCPCITNYGGDNYSNHTSCAEATLNESKLNGPVFECNSLCACKGSQCGNRLVQYGPRKHLKIISSGPKGLGLYTDTFIRKGSFVCEYGGEVISIAEANVRHNDNRKKNKMNYIFCLKEHSQGKCTLTLIDPSRLGNIGRYINHSCVPNCCIVPVRVDTPLPKLAIFTAVDIMAGSEVTFDYGACEAEGSCGGAGHTKCLCGSPGCRQWLPYAAELD